METQTVPSTPDTTKVEVPVVNNAPKTDAEKLYAKEEVATTETKVEETKTEEVKTETAFELKLSEGSALDQSAVEKIVALAKERGLSQEAAQQMLSEQDQLVTGYRDLQLQQHMEARKQWVEETKNDKEFGGDKFQENLAGASALIKKYGDETLINDLNVSGYGDKASVFRFLAKIAKDLKVNNDTYVKATAPAIQKKEPHEILYGDK